MSGFSSDTSIGFSASDVNFRRASRSRWFGGFIAGFINGLPCNFLCDRGMSMWKRQRRFVQSFHSFIKSPLISLRSTMELRKMILDVELKQSSL
jgi:hypothetical protein